eukprot:CAMPEP_0206226522 /NCGR_PEP_ID=MMETSP0047_2-20121206/8143_1 /ASSEMBLY_ACC=CAM_ASM_000192 /TAXON_ID=195065 /ORGANISM="Chroomonas mesostigmatica_cf, Strain CCMP1168" /LENGTH=452 /DNA_ID=CAMNT_0053649629 /DNA_START=67 /DNA_END=1425 /DNA_ORIENTATION=-
MKSLASSLVLLLCLAALLATNAQEAPKTSPVRADEPQNDQKEENGDEDILKPIQQRKTCEEEAETIDAHLISRKSGWDVEATKKHMMNQRAFTSLVKRIATSEKYRSRFAGAAMAQAPGEEATMWFKGPLKEAREIQILIDNNEDIQDMSIKIVDGMRFSEEEQEERGDKIMVHLAERFGLSEGIGAAIRPGDLLLITLPSDNERHPVSEPRETPCLGKGGDMVDAQLLKDMDLLPKEMQEDPRGIMFEFTDGNQDEDLHARGGRRVYGSGQCTSGFSVYRISDGLNGITTAGHCTGMSTFDAEFPEADFSLFHRAEHCGSHGDIEWKTTNHIEPAEYWASPTDRRDVHSVEDWYCVNNWYCLYSRMTGTRVCDQVYSTSTSQSGCGGRTSYRLVAMDDLNGVPGDSGGPWSWGTMAVGTVKGYKTIWFSKRATFTKATRFDNALGVWVRTK